jgi:hypothetical protein
MYWYINTLDCLLEKDYKMKIFYFDFSLDSGSNSMISKQVHYWLTITPLKLNTPSNEQAI